MNAYEIRAAALDASARLFAGALSNGDEVTDEDVKAMSASLESYIRTGKVSG